MDRTKAKGCGFCHLLKLDPSLTSREKSFPQASLARAQGRGVGCGVVGGGGVSVSSSFRVASSKGWGRQKECSAELRFPSRCPW